LCRLTVTQSSLTYCNHLCPWDIGASERNNTPERGTNFIISANYLLPLVAMVLGVAILAGWPRPEALLAMALICRSIWLRNGPQPKLCQ
jgi:hypothetical protein